MTYQEADKLIQGITKDRDIRLCNDTYLTCYSTVQVGNKNLTYGMPSNVYAIKLHNVEIIKFYPDGTIELNSGGCWMHTIKTKNKINKYVDYIRVYQNHFTWHVAIKDVDNSISRFDELFFDGMQIRNGELLNK